MHSALHTKHLQQPSRLHFHMQFLNDMSVISNTLFFPAMIMEKINKQAGDY